MAVRNRRAALVRELSRERYQSLAQAAVGQVKSGLILKRQENANYQTLTREYWPVRVRGDGTLGELRAGDEVTVKMVRFVPPPQGRMDGWFEGEVFK